MEEVLLFLIGFFATFIGTIAGGGGLISMPAMLMIGVPIHSAIAANKFSNTFSSFSSFIVLLREGKINVKSALIVGPFSVIGGITGGLIASNLSEQKMTIIAIILLCFALLLNIVKKPTNKNGSLAQVPKKNFPYLYGISVYDGMFRPGQATLLMYTYLHHGFSYLSAVAFTRFQTFLSCFGAFFTYLLSGHFKFEIALFLALGSIVGAQSSVRIANKLSTSQLQLLLKLVTLLFIIQLSYRMIIQ